MLNAVVSDLFGQYADRRLIEAALDADKPGKTFVVSDDTATRETSIWIDYVADVSDGFDGTYTIAYLLAQPSLTIGGKKLTRGSALFLGGDEVYPIAERDDYIIKLRKPYEFAWPGVDSDKFAPKIFAIPGNHDWYDGLVVFLAMFCREKRTRYGNWGSVQRRSYFSVKLTEKWWLWGIDIALTRDMDQPQADYFVHAATDIPENSNIILCSAEPGWYVAAGDGNAYRALGYASSLARKAERKLHIPLVLSGDTHHYARYSGADTHFVTSGGGGAFVHGTHDLPAKIPIRWYHHQKETALTLQAAYPSQQDSQRELRGNFWFFEKNLGFSFALGVIYWILAFVLTSLWRPDVGVIEYLLLFCVFFFYARYQEKKYSLSTFLDELLHSAAHFGSIWLLSAGAISLYSRALPQTESHWFIWLVALAPIIPIGAYIGAFIFGLNLYLTCRFRGRNNNDAFSAMRLDTHRHFIRMHVDGDTLTLYPIGVDRVLTRDNWEMNPERKLGSADSVFVPDTSIGPRLIEDPIIIRGSEAPSTEQIKPVSGTPEQSS